MTGQDLYNEISRLREKIDYAQNMIKKHGLDAASAKRKYSIAFTQEQLIEKDRGMAITILDKQVKGKKHIADLMFDWDCAEVNYDAAKRGLDNYKKQLTVVFEFYKMENYRAGQD
jgi:hypothetical protein